MSSGKVLLGVLAGIAVGALVGTLLAPEKGSDTRQKLADKGDDLLEDFKGQFGDLISSLKDKFDQKVEEAEGVVSKGKSKYNEAKNEFKNSMAEL